MTGRRGNLLEEPLIGAAPLGYLSLPGLLAALALDKVESFPALRPHQAPLWHMFLVQLAALALHRTGRRDIPQEEGEWGDLLRGLTADYPQDEPWCLVVADWTRPAFLQPPVPQGVPLENPVTTPDALDLLITSRNHDIKQAIAREGRPEDWALALISLQTGEGFGGRDNQGIARMNGGSSSRPMLTLAPLPAGGSKEMSPRAGAWFRRDLRVLVETREDVLDASHIDYPDTGLGLTWLAPWPEGGQLQLTELDIWFVEVCRRIRLIESDGRIGARKGNSKATRINAKQYNGVLADPWAPVHATESKSFTLSGGDFNYRTLKNLALSGDWIRPLLATPASFEKDDQPFVLVAAALARGNSKTEGFKSRLVPLKGRVAHALGYRRKELHELAEDQVRTIAEFDKAMSYALVLAAAGGDRERIDKEHYTFTKAARNSLDRYADEIFFERLWGRFEAQEVRPDAADNEKKKLADLLWRRTQEIFEQALPAMPCAGLFRPRAEARARRALEAQIRKSHPALFPRNANTAAHEEEDEVDAA
jgi:CRISPR system Cascade subunit CasA